MAGQIISFPNTEMECAIALLQETLIITIQLWSYFHKTGLNPMKQDKIDRLHSIN